jgi:uncharacterized protein (TIGR02246 family)
MNCRALILAIVFGVLLQFSLTSSAIAAEDEATQATTRIVASLDRAWNAGDGWAFAAEYWPDAEFVNIFGMIMDGQKNIAERHVQVFEGPFKGTRMNTDIRRIRMLAPNVIIADTVMNSTGGQLLGSRTAQTRLKHVLEKRNGVWRIVASQNTEIAPPRF